MRSPQITREGDIWRSAGTSRRLARVFEDVLGKSTAARRCTIRSKRSRSRAGASAALGWKSAGAHPIAEPSVPQARDGPARRAGRASSPSHPPSVALARARDAAEVSASRLRLGTVDEPGGRASSLTRDGGFGVTVSAAAAGLACSTTWSTPRRRRHRGASSACWPATAAHDPAASGLADPEELGIEACRSISISITPGRWTRPGRSEGLGQRAGPRGDRRGSSRIGVPELGRPTVTSARLRGPRSPPSAASSARRMRGGIRRRRGRRRRGCGHAARLLVLVVPTTGGRARPSAVGRRAAERTVARRGRASPSRQANVDRCRCCSPAEIAARPRRASCSAPDPISGAALYRRPLPVRRDRAAARAGTLPPSTSARACRRCRRQRDEPSTAIRATLPLGLRRRTLPRAICCPSTPVAAWTGRPPTRRTPGARTRSTRSVATTVSTAMRCSTPEIGRVFALR